MRPFRAWIQLVTLAALALLASAGAPPAGERASAEARVRGAYEVLARGFYAGSGRAVVSNSVQLDLQLTGEDGQQGPLRATSLAVADGRFSGEGTFLGRRVTIAGRVEPPDGKILRAARLQCWFSLPGEHRGAICGRRVGAEPS